MAAAYELGKRQQKYLNQLQADPKWAKSEKNRFRCRTSSLASGEHTPVAATSRLPC